MASGRTPEFGRIRPRIEIWRRWTSGLNRASARSRRWCFRASRRSSLPSAREWRQPVLVRYLESTGRTWQAFVAATRAKRMEITGWADDPAADGNDAE